MAQVCTRPKGASYLSCSSKRSCELIAKGSQDNPPALGAPGLVASCSMGEEAQKCAQGSR
jgi:hypothetical protein